MSRSISLFAGIVLSATLAALILTGCTDPDGAKKAAEDMGFRDVKAGGYGWFSCDGKSDTFSTRFTAINAQGRPVSGVVCSGWLKGATVRLF